MKEERKAGTEVEEIISDEAGQESPLTLKEFLEEAVSLLLTVYHFLYISFLYQKRLFGYRK